MDQLIASLREPSEEAKIPHLSQCRAARQLGESGSPLAVSPLLETLRNPRSTRILKFRCAEAIARLGPAGAAAAEPLAMVLFEAVVDASLSDPHFFDENESAWITTLIEALTAVDPEARSYPGRLLELAASADVPWYRVKLAIIVHRHFPEKIREAMLARLPGYPW